MEYYCGIDVSLEQSSVCVVDGKGSIVREAMPVKTGRKNARGIGQLIVDGARTPSTDRFRAVHRKSLPAQEVRAVLTARKLVQAKLHDVPVCRSAAPKIRHDGPDLRRDAAAGGDIEMSLRGILRG